MIEKDLESYLDEIDKHTLTDSAFVWLADEEIGLCVDVVCEYDERTGWKDSVLCFMEEYPNDEDYEYAEVIARALAEELDIPVKRDGNI